MDNMTALVSAFARAYHYRNNNVPIFADQLAEKMLTGEEYDAISQNMTQGIFFFAPGFTGRGEDALRYIVDHQLSPSVLARSAFCERTIRNLVRLGCRQIVLYACGYDTFSLRMNDPAVTVFELDKPEMMADRQARIARAGLQANCQVVSISCDLSEPSWKDRLTAAGFDAKKLSFESLLGISYYLSKEEFSHMIRMISSISCAGSSICLDYPLSEEGTESRRNRELAAAAGEQMKAKYSCDEIEELLSDAGFRICEHMDSVKATEVFFSEYNLVHKDNFMTAPEGVGYCLAVKKEDDKRRFLF